MIHAVKSFDILNADAIFYLELIENVIWLNYKIIYLLILCGKVFSGLCAIQLLYSIV